MDRVADPAVADYFYAKTAVTATLEALEVPLAPVAGVVLAQVPYQLVKLRTRLEGGSASDMRVCPTFFPPTPLLCDLCL